MVTIKSVKGVMPFASIRREPLPENAAHRHGRSGSPASPARYLEANAITHAFCTVILQLHNFWRCIEPITCFSIMPDHIHLLIKIRSVENRVSLPKIVWQLKRRLEQAYWATGGAVAGSTPNDMCRAGRCGATGGAVAGSTPNDMCRAGRCGATGGAVTGGAPNDMCRAGRYEATGGVVASNMPNDGDACMSSAASCAGGLHVFEREWHDWIVKSDGQLKAFTRYIRENPYRSWLRSCHRENFRRVEEIDFLGRKWFGYGNVALLDLPVIEPFRCSRKWEEGGTEWNAAVARAERIGPGGAGIGTFMSPCEKICGNAIYKTGGGLIVLSPEGFGERWHPPRNKEALCAKGRMLFLSLYPEMARQPARKELYDRCHEMGDVVASKIQASCW